MAKLVKGERVRLVCDVDNHYDVGMVDSVSNDTAFVIWDDLERGSESAYNECLLVREAVTLASKDLLEACRVALRFGEHKEYCTPGACRCWKSTVATALNKAEGK
jgi:hypothetical protein